MPSLSRRRVIEISACLIGLGGTSSWAGPVKQSTSSAKTVFEWKGQALGAETSLQIAHDNRDEALKVLAACRNEMERLEQIFSLYRPTSEVSILNASGALPHPSLDMRACLSEALFMSKLTGGAFDISVGPLWQYYKEYFGNGQSRDAFSGLEFSHVRSLVGYDKIEVAAQGIRLAQPGMKLTFNGIAQGYITDRITELLSDAGFNRVLVSLGEMHALQGPTEDSPWRVEIQTPSPTQEHQVLEIENQALATSAGSGLQFDKESGINHLIDPRSGLSVSPWDQVTVAAPSAARADALSTGLTFLGQEVWHEVLGQAGAHYSIGWKRDGQMTRIAV